MIPAILSCIFVIYLYQTLNHVDDSTDTGDDQQQQSSLTPASLSVRIEQIQKRLEKLAKGTDS